MRSSIAIVADLPEAIRTIAFHVLPWRSRKISINSKSISESRLERDGIVEDMGMLQ